VLVNTFLIWQLTLQVLVSTFLIWQLTLQVLVNISGTQWDPVRGISLEGIGSADCY